MKKKIVLITAAAMLAGTLAVGATLAYFTDSAKAVNVITMGNVNISLTEPIFSSSGISTPNDKGEYEYNQVIYPGQPIEKDPVITVEDDSLDAYLRVKIEVTGDKITEADKQAIIGSLKVKNKEGNLVDLASVGWVQAADGYFYYQSKVVEGDKVPVFNQFLVPDTWNNEYGNSKFSIAIQAEAIQYNYFTPEVNEEKQINGWHMADGTPVVAESYNPPAGE